jgi:hypothetical protein
MKEILIRAQVDEVSGRVATLIKQKGFTTSMGTILETIGILENLKQQQLEKLKSQSISQNGLGK